MYIHEYIFKILGFNIIKKSDLLTEMVDIELGDDSIVPKIRSNSYQNKNEKQKRIIVCVYNFIIFCIISWQVFFGLVIAIQTKNIKYLGGYIFQLICSLQYLISIKYFRTNHLDNLLLENQNLIKILNNRSVVSFCISLIISTLLVVFITKGINMEKHSIPYLLYKHKKNGLWIFYFLSNFFGYLIFLINVSIFSVTMDSHKDDIIKYVTNLKNYMTSSVLISDKVSRLSIEILGLQDKFNDSVEKLNLLFSITSVLGLVHIFVTLNFWLSGIVISTDIINFVIFLLIEYIYINSIQTLKLSISNISNEIKLPIYMGNLLQKNNIDRKVHTLDDFNNKKLYESVICTQIYAVQIIEYQSLQQLQFIINEPWACFEIFGLKISDTTIIHKMLGILIAVFIADSLSSALSFQV